MPIPDVVTLLGMEPEELGVHLLRAMRASLAEAAAGGGGNQQLHLNNDTPVLAKRMLGLGWNDPIPEGRDKEVERAVVEAWCWLESQALLVPASRFNGGDGWRVLSRRAARFTAVADFPPHGVARRLDPNDLDPRIRDRAWGAFVRGDFEGAAFAALKGVEVAVREAAGLGNGFYGRTLMGKAFDPPNGPLVDQQAEGSEQQARRDLFCGAIGLLKNPLSHRDVGLGDAAEAVEVVLLANHLLRIVRRQIGGRLKSDIAPDGAATKA